MRRFVPFVEGMRGLAALYVMLAHIYAYSKPAGFGFFNFGPMGVAVFIVISGYCLALPLADAPFDVRAFLVRRAKRILPPYYGALVLSTLLFLVWARLVHHPVPLRTLAVGFISHALLLHNLISPAGSSYLNGAMWSVALEAQIYLVFAFVMVWSFKRFGVWPTVIGACVLSLAPVLMWSEPYLLGAFGLGAAVALRPLRHAGLIGSAGAAAAIVILWVFGQRGLEGAQIAISLGTAGFIAARPAVLVRLLETKVALRLGEFSYSLYLVHAPIVRVLAVFLPTSALLIMAAPFIVLFAWGFYLAVERPFISRFRKRSEAIIDPPRSPLLSAPLTHPHQTPRPIPAAPDPQASIR